MRCTTSPLSASEVRTGSGDARPTRSTTTRLANVEHVVEIVADDEQGDALPLQCIDQLEDLALLLDAERWRSVHP